MPNNDKKYYHDNIPQEERTDADPEAKRKAQILVDKFEQEKASGKTINDIKENNCLRQELNELEMENRGRNNNTQLRVYGNPDENTIRADFIDRRGNVADEIVSSKTPPGITDRTAYYDGFEPLTDVPHNPADNSPHTSDDSALGASEAESLYHSPSPGSGSNEGSSEEGASEEGASEEGASEEGASEEASSQEVAGPLRQVSLADPSPQEESSDSSKETEPKAEESKKRKRDDESDNDDGAPGPSKRIDLEDYLMDPGSDIYDFSGD